MIRLWLLVVVCVIQVLTSDWGNSNEYLRFKRAKYYSSPQRFYSKPPPSFPIQGPFSVTPPTPVMTEDNIVPSYSRPQRYKQPLNDGLNDRDFNNLINYLTKRDLDKIIEFANEKERSAKKNNNIEVYKANVFDDTALQDPNSDSRYPIQGENNNSPVNYLQEPFQSKPIIYVTSASNNNPYASGYSKEQNSHAVFDVDSETNFGIGNINVFTDSRTMKEEDLPKPENLREDSFDAIGDSYAAASQRSSTYDIASFSDLPLMNFHNSKLHSVSSYHVPHYTVTTSAQPAPVVGKLSTSSSDEVPIVPAPSKSAAAVESEAQLKAIKVWTHRSRGTAYTLHDDGTLTLEKPVQNVRSIPNYRNS